MGKWIILCGTAEDRLVAQRAQDAGGRSGWMTRSRRRSRRSALIREIHIIAIRRPQEGNTCEENR